ncbi:MAG: class I SAM-dependent methyltransferase [Oscillospiraceae bacterium]|nr:class I SAM-dependent methyltransferase [Oscillospiraceae bacterium]
MDYHKYSELKLTPRLRAVADWVPQGARLCDVGTDHAYLPTALTLEGRISHAIASDIRKGPLERAAATLIRYGLTAEAVETRLCPGLEAIHAGEGNAVTICGMGGEMIVGILEAAPWTKEDVTLVLQPQRSQEELRLWLKANGYRIQRERVVAEGTRWYTVLLAEGGTETLDYSPAAALVGHPDRWVEEPSRLLYLQSVMEKQTKLLANLERSSKESDVEKRALTQQIIADLSGWILRLTKGKGQI